MAIVTGGAGGIGRSIAERLAAEGAGLALWDVDAATAEATAAALRIAGSEVEAFAVDVTAEASVEAATNATFERFGRVDLVVNNAGILGPVAPTWEHTPDAFRRVLDVNLVGTFLVCRAVVPRLLAQDAPGRCRIVNLASIQGKEGMPSPPPASHPARRHRAHQDAGRELAGAASVNCVTLRRSRAAWRR